MIVPLTALATSFAPIAQAFEGLSKAVDFPFPLP